MSTYAQLESAFHSLSGALEKLEAACERRRKADLEHHDREEELAVLQDDRTRLALELDDLQAHTKSLELANTEVAHRLGKVTASLKAILAQATVLQTTAPEP